MGSATRRLRLPSLLIARKRLLKTLRALRRTRVTGVLAPIPSRDVLGIRTRETQHHLTCTVQFAAGSNHPWPEAEVTIMPSEGWHQATPPEALLFPMFLSRLTSLPEAYDRFYGRAVSAVLMEILDRLTKRALESEATAQRPTRGYGMTLDVLSPRTDERAELAGQAVLTLIPERVSRSTGPSYARIVAKLQTKKKLSLDLSMPPHEPEKRKRRNRPEKSLVLGSAAYIALVEELCKTQDYSGVVVPTIEVVRDQVTRWREKHDSRGNQVS
jgi:hypothetical protein